jgi:hypothetical protein
MSIWSLLTTSRIDGECEEKYHTNNPRCWIAVVGDEQEREVVAKYGLGERNNIE